jgi:hypothetical protein
MARTVPDRGIRNTTFRRVESAPRRADDPPMNPNDTAMTQQPQIDERFVGDWIRFGLIELEAYLGKHARFDAYYRGREAGTGTAL